MLTPQPWHPDEDAFDDAMARYEKAQEHKQDKAMRYALIAAFKAWERVGAVLVGMMADRDMRDAA